MKTAPPRTESHHEHLYDECENILDSRFIKKDDVIQSGEAIAFASYLVDINHLEGDHKPAPNVNCQKTEKKSDEKPTTFCTRRYKKGFSSPGIASFSVFGKFVFCYSSCTFE